MTSDFDVLEASGIPKGDQESPESSEEAPKKLPRSPQEAPKRFLGGALGALGGPKSSPSHDPRYIHRFQSLQEPSRRSPSHDLSALSTFLSLQKKDPGVRLSVEPGPVGPPDTLAHASIDIRSLEKRSRRRYPEGRRISGPGRASRLNCSTKHARLEPVLGAIHRPSLPSVVLW